MAKTKIEWCDHTWSPITGCTPLSTGCKHCYAQRMAKRLAGRCGYDKEMPFRITLHRNKMLEPLTRSVPTIYFVCSMGDLFHPDIPHVWVYEVFDVMSACRQHTFLVLTKRPDHIHDVLYGPPDWYLGGGDFLPNVWLGTSVESQEYVHRLDTLGQLVGWHKFVSLEPLLGPINLSPYLPHELEEPDRVQVTHEMAIDAGMPQVAGSIIEWGTRIVQCTGLEFVIVGGETGPGARPTHPQWARDIRDQCMQANVPLFLKSWGNYLPGDQSPHGPLDEKWRVAHNAGRITQHKWPDGSVSHNVGASIAGHLLDNQEWRQTPFPLQVPGKEAG